MWSVQMFVLLLLMLARVRGLSYAGTTVRQTDAVVSSRTEVARETATGSSLVKSASVNVDHSICPVTIPRDVTEMPVPYAPLIVLQSVNYWRWVCEPSSNQS